MPLAAPPNRSRFGPPRRTDKEHPAVCLDRIAARRRPERGLRHDAKNPIIVNQQRPNRDSDPIGEVVRRLIECKLPHRRKGTGRKRRQKATQFVAGQKADRRVRGRSSLTWSATL